MARGNFRISDRICLHCGFDAMSDNKMHLPYMYGKGANKAYLCKKCANISKNVAIKNNPHTDYLIY
ncbi:hypothetical protein [Lachnotalea glycerini]|uniref:Uncharacterized protein n=1 Tax=Lachnotalea glycerini TaxID=1763509 RepID=A0A371JCB4_9FIRM|nr:hypothetical protein [Lachnotalea glycerini]RDY30317.1 hypothetical protein CG710_015400 [Lachnotalea glycerini]